MWFRNAILVAFLVAGPVQASEIQWKSSLSEGLTSARENHSLVYVQIVTEWCGYCQKLQNEDYPRPEVKKLLSQFVTVSIDGDRQPEVAARFNARGYPTLLVLQPDGTVVARMDGYPGPERLKSVLGRLLSENTMAGAELHPLDQALQSLRAKDFGRAVELLNPFIENSETANTELALARYYRGLAFVGMGNHNAARDDLSFAARRAPLPEQRSSAREILAGIEKNSNIASSGE